MSASTSRNVLRSITSNSSSLSSWSIAGPPSRHFTTSLPRSLKQRRVLVELLEDVPGVGSRWDRVFVNAGKQRSMLGPVGQARILPWKRAIEKVVVRTRTIKGGPTHDPLIEAPGATLSAESEFPEPSQPAIPTPQSLLNQLHLLPPRLHFQRRTISLTSSDIHGSLTLSDVQEKLANEYEFPSTVVEVQWKEVEGELGGAAAGRIKELGVKQAVVRLRQGGREEVGIEVEVVRME